ncbi:inositol polyphosphate multikinase-like [Styela clava]
MSVHAAGQSVGAGNDSTKQKTTHHHKHQVASALVQNTENVNSSDVIPPLPKGCKPLAHQVAGHRFGQGRLKLGMLQHTDGSILKPVQPPPRGECEVNFYTKVFNPKCEDPVLMTLRPFLPKYLGLCHPIIVENESESPAYMKLEDACRRFRNPSILDIKIGRVSYDPHADEAKIAFETGKYPPQQNLGFQLLGMRVSGQSPNEAIFLDKKWGRSLTEETIMDGLEVFFTGNKAWRKHLIKAFLQRLETILIWFESQSQLQFYSSSILLIYEGEFFDGSSDSDEEFMHKYRSYVPNNFRVNECFRAIDKVLQANLTQDLRENSLEESLEFPTCDFPSQHTKTTSSNENNESSSTNEQQKQPQHEDKTKETYATNKEMSQTQPSVPAGGDNSNNQTFRTPSGNESGYSSEVDSKKKLSSEVRVQQEFVNNLSRKMQQHAMTEYSKYRFPPDLVDVRMIDFTHIFEDKCKDENYIYGLRNLITHLRLLLKRS